MTTEQQNLTPRDFNVLDLIREAISNKHDVEVLRGLFELQRDFMRMQAEQAYNGAMSRLQAKIPQINKYGQARNSKFAKLEDIDVVIRPLLAEEGFSFSFDEEKHGEKLSTFVAKLAHERGHSETKRLTLPVDSSASNREGKSIRPAIQDAGSTVSYARRYLIKMHLNLIEKDEDSDGESREPINPDQVKDIYTLIADSKSDLQKFLRQIANAESVEQIPAYDYKRVCEVLEERKLLRQKIAESEKLVDGGNT